MDISLQIFAVVANAGDISVFLEEEIANTEESYYKRFCGLWKKNVNSKKSRSKCVDGQLQSRRGRKKESGKETREIVSVKQGQSVV